MLTFAYPDTFVWMILLPLAASPLVYLIGRLGLLGGNPQLRSLPRWLALVVLALTWIPFFSSVQQFAQYGPITRLVENIPLVLDGLSLLLAAVALGLGTMVALFSGAYMAGENGEEKYYAMLIAMVGVMIGLGCAGDLFNLWVWFEAMAVTSYLLVVFYREQPASLEAGVKYVVQSATGSVLVLLGIALVLAFTGTVHLDEIHQSAQAGPMLLAAGALFVIGFGVKTALVPMHTWLPDAHTQAPSGISAMLSGVVIEAGLIAMLRALAALTGAESFSPATWGTLLMAFGAFNMLIGNLMALRQKQVKRLLAYSSLSHVGYMIVGLGIAIYAGQAAGAEGGLFHLFNHGLMKGLAFLAAGALLYAISGMGRKDAAGSHDDHGPLTVADLDGAAQRYPLAALALSLAVLGLGGLPPLAGFMSKWQIFVAGFQTHNWWIGALVAFAALNSVLSLAYYAPLVNAVYRNKPSPAVEHGAAIPATMSISLVIMALAVVALGFWPSLLQWLTGPAGRSLMAAFGG
jgi:proton-translocating NADH-quinone oxidoreductase chain N